MDQEILVKKWLSNELSESEMASFKALKDAALYEEIVEEAQRFGGNENAKVLSFDEFEKQLPAKDTTKTINWTKIISSIAAILVVGIALFTVLNQDNINSYTTELAQNETITLPDNSIVNLNELSHLEYNASKWSEKRSLNLEGEAFFDVEKGKRFDVVTSQGIVSVLGTEFNVLSRENEFKVSCYEGLVTVNYNNKEVIVPAGTEFSLKSGNTEKTKVTIAEPHWIKRMSVFENATLQDVFTELEKQYDIKVNYQRSHTIHFTGAFEHNNLENALKSITNPLNLSFLIQNKEVTIENATK